MGRMRNIWRLSNVCNAERKPSTLWRPLIALSDRHSFSICTIWLLAVHWAVIADAAEASVDRCRAPHIVAMQ